jgi:hypothetical protein
VRLRFQADNDLNRAIIEGLRRREPSVSFQTAARAKFDRLPDREVLRRAANENRVLVSHDLNTLLPEFQAFTEAVSSPGLVLIPQRLSIGLAIESLLLLWSVSEHDEWRNRICLLPTLSVVYQRIR